MRQDLLDCQPLRDIAIEHLPYQVDTLVADDVRDAQVAIHDLVDTVEGVLLVDDGVEEDAEGPDVLFLAAVGLAGEDLRGGVICRLFRLVCYKNPRRKMLEGEDKEQKKTYQWYPQTHQRVRS